MGVLDGIKILELARVPPAELPGMMFADMGADVLKIETPSETQEDPDWQRRSAFVYVNRNKRSLALNMKAPEGQALFGKLAAGADVIIEGFRPGVMKRLGAHYEAIRAINPRIVYCSLSGFGQNGPYRDYPAHDMNYLSLAGVLALIGEPDRKPAIPLNLVADYAGASMHGALGVMYALFARERTGKGQHVDVSYLDTSIALLAATLQPDELLNLAPEQILKRLFWQETVRLFEPLQPRFACTCSRQRVAGMLRGLGRDEVDSLLAEQGQAEVACDFCGVQYRFDAVDIGEVFVAAHEHAPGSQSVN